MTANTLEIMDREAEAAVNEAAAYGVQVQPASPGEGATWWRVVNVRHLSADENRGKHNVYVKVLDEQGSRARDPRLRIMWTWEGKKAEESADPATLDKRDGELGHGDIAVEEGVHATVWIDGDGSASDRIVNLHTDHDVLDKTSDNQNGNYHYHHSYQVTFQRTRKESAPAPVPQPEPAQPPVAPPAAPPLAGIFQFDVWPTTSRVISQYFGENPALCAENKLAGHEGIDIAAAIGDPVYCVSAGTARVVQSFDDGQPYGIHVRIDHAQGYQSIYAHLSKSDVQVGDVVNAGQQIGQTGNSGKSTGPHLHFSLKKAGAQTSGYPPGYIDPSAFLLKLLAASPAPVGTQPSAASADAAEFVRDGGGFTDGSELAAGDPFTKVWLVRNSGQTAWTEAYRLVPMGDERLGAPPSISVPVTPPGQEAQILVHFRAPSEPGRKKSVWRLANAEGVPFGQQMWTEIVVRQTAPAIQTPATLAAPTEQQIRIPANAGWAAQQSATFWNRYGGIVLAESKSLGIDPEDAVAVLVTESAGEPFGPSGRMTIRFENHIFYQFWGKSNRALYAQHFAFSDAEQVKGHMWRPDAQSAWQACHVDQATEWSVFEFARTLDATSALKSISMGAAQIMGFNYATVGYPTPQAMFDAFQQDAGAQISAMFRFMEVNQLVDAVRTKDYLAFARIYNGAGQADAYAGRMRDFGNGFRLLRSGLAGEMAREQEGVAQAHDEPEERSPMPASPKPGVPLAEADPELYKAWRMHIENGFKNNETMFGRVLAAFMNPYWVTVWMYGALFAVGIVAFVVALILGFRTSENPVALPLFGGLSVLAFLSFFISRPLQALEENLQFITWLGIIYNTYWTSLVQSQNPDTYQQALEQATQSAIARIKELTELHGRSSKSRPAADESPAGVQGDSA